MNRPPLLTQDEFHNAKMAMIPRVRLDVLHPHMQKMSRLKLKLHVAYMKSLGKVQDGIYKAVKRHAS